MVSKRPGSGKEAPAVRRAQLARAGLAPGEIFEIYGTSTFPAPAFWPVKTRYRSKKKRYTFFFFPAEIRNMIYGLSLNWPDSLALYRGFNNQSDEYYRKKRSGEIPDGEHDYTHFPVFSGKLITPTILLLCRRITTECLSILQSRSFVVDRLPPILPAAGRFMRLTQFVGRRTLQSLRRIDVRLSLCDGKLGSGWAWDRVVADLLAVLRERNCFIRLRVMIKITAMQNVPLLYDECRFFMSITGQVGRARNRIRIHAHVD